MSKELKIISYNVNGIRAAMRKGLIEYLSELSPDIVCLQELKAKPEQIDEAAFHDLGYHNYWYSAQKPGYSGVAILSKIKADHVEYGIQYELYDYEGRIVRVDLGDLSIISAYFPSGSSGEARQAVKIQFLNDFYEYIEKLKKKRKKIIIAGDYNICHKAIDIHNPKTNKNTSGFLPEEREWMSKFFDLGFIDSFRAFHEETPHKYSWWSYRANARQNNKGWRIDYISASQNLREQLLDADIFPEAKQSDHCPIYLKLAMK